MEKPRRNPIFIILQSGYLILRFFLRWINKVLFGWLDIWLQRKEDATLLSDIRMNLHFLFPVGSVVKEPWYRVLPFDYSSVGINYGNVCFWFARGQDQLNVSVTHRKEPREIYELSAVVAALDSTDVTEQHPTRSLSEVGDALRPRLNALNDAFSESRYSEFKTRLSTKRKALQVLTKEAEWELNKKLYH
jgi:hypothetical protein